MVVSLDEKNWSETDKADEIAEKLHSEESRTEEEIQKENDLEQTDTKKKKTNFLKEAFSWVMVVVCAFVLAFFVTNFVIIKAEVPTGSMISTIMIGDRLIGNRLAYLFSDPERGDIVMFPYPDNEEEIYIKRVIGVPGDTVQVKEGVLYLNGEVFEEDYLNEPMKKEEDTELFTVPEGCYFMMGDNRNDSWDSRFWEHKFVAKKKIIGKAEMEYFPKIKLLF